MVYDKDSATRKTAEDPVDVVEQLEKQGGDDVLLTKMLSIVVTGCVKMKHNTCPFLKQ